ncbi:MAG: acyl CoA:acetate/3-ketoacid CoA transferase [Dehalococcoidia bacterium]|nr:acyl CoA:acetate/3-ketoacid CoA transferase [Dehalococcoidia bacterium]
MALALKLGSKLCTAEEAVQLVRDGDCITVSGTVSWQLPSKVLRALEVRFLTENAPRNLTWFEPFPTGIPGIEPLSYPGLLKRVVGGWYTPHPRLRELIVANQVEAYLYPLGSLSFLCQAMAAGRDVFVTKVGLETYLDPRHGGGKLNTATTEDLVSLTEINGEQYIAYKQLPIHVAIIRASVVDEAGNVSLENEHTTMNSLYQALAAKRFGGKVIVQCQRVVPTGHIPARLVEIPGTLVDAIVVDRNQYDDEMMPELPWMNPFLRVSRPPSQVLAAADKEAWERWMAEGATDEERAPRERRLSPDVLIGRRAVSELMRGDVVNIGQGLPARDMLPVVAEEELDSELELSIETGHLGGIVNGNGFRANTTAIMDTPGIFSFYGSSLVRAAFFSMLEFDSTGNVNLLKYGDTWVGPGGSMDIAESVGKVVFCGTLRAGGLQAEGRDGKLSIAVDGAVPRAVEHVQGVCFNGRKMLAEGKDVLYVTERAVFRLTAEGPELIEVAPGVDVETDVIGQMGFRPRVSSALRPMDPRIFTPGPMGLKNTWCTATAG